MASPVLGTRHRSVHYAKDSPKSEIRHSVESVSASSGKVSTSSYRDSTSSYRGSTASPGVWATVKLSPCTLPAKRHQSLLNR